MRNAGIGLASALISLACCSGRGGPEVNTAFKVGVSQQGAIAHHFLDPSKIYFSVQPTENEVQDVTVTTTLYSADKAKVATFACHVGNVGKGQTREYAGISCDRTPRTPYSSSDDLLADISVTFTATTKAVSGVPVKNIPHAPTPH